MAFAHCGKCGHYSHETLFCAVSECGCSSPSLCYCPTALAHETAAEKRRAS